MLFSSQFIIDKFIEKTKHDENFNKLLLASLFKAKKIATEQLNPDLFKALSWPLSLEEYNIYLVEFSKWIPRESKDAIWKIPGTNGHQEVDDRTNHFYWLVDQEVGVDNTTLVENIAWFSKWLIEYAQSWGNFLDTTDSFNQETLNTFCNNSPLYKVEDSMIGNKPNNPSGWLTFNQFFARELNPGMRPIACPFDNTIVTSPADCNFKGIYHIGADSTIPEIIVKNTHKFSSIEHLLQGSIYNNAFAGGTFVHYYLSTFSYHRFHTPVAGIVKECYPIHGLVYLDVKIKNNQFDSPDSAEDGYEFAQARGVITIDTTHSPFGNIGIVAIIPIGMCQVSSVNMIATVGSELLKGDEFGYFLFGGSDIIVLFQEGTNPQIDKDEKYRLYGSEIAKCTKL
ncbi:MAG: phosphatidylserine decarboxylase [Bacteroidota bacterium]|nr:phosphatidylserine decarboxylase [Bacteroidota bacterium]